ncbi:MAG: GDP-mannose 4,6-dehydratase [Candidatus Altiarchaeota archaeon]|nr:GDP-mannose 4,6-dehydratase [Candidatus Altiarchaeota archaeon]MBU4436820.1 GDP-mannose 4,6-dehydratase [Candidatus Altiarchaeota archaeon]
MNSLVTGCAGFIGSWLSERLLELGHEVIGVDCFIDYYPRGMKEMNLKPLRGNENFLFIPYSLLNLDLNEILKDVDYVFHQAAQAGVRHSWGRNFGVYTDNNILATQRLLEACRNSDVKKVIYASSSSVYGDVDSLPMKESDLPRPVSPYGVSKLAGEHLCHLYHKNYGINSMSLRYFTIYGPRQRPDMAFNKFTRAILNDKEITIYGNGKQTRDFTYVDDAIEANILAMKSQQKDGVYNIAGGSKTTVNDCIKILEEIIGKKAIVRNIETQKGDVKHTYADTSRAAKDLGYKSKVSLREGLEKEVEWIKSIESV